MNQVIILESLDELMGGLKALKYIIYDRPQIKQYQRNLIFNGSLS
jgi:hypothetical protein